MSKYFEEPGTVSLDIDKHHHSRRPTGPVKITGWSRDRDIAAAVPLVTAVYTSTPSRDEARAQFDPGSPRATACFAALNDAPAFARAGRTAASRMDNANAARGPC